jgi:hypothetical protein
LNRSRPPYAAVGDFFARILDCPNLASPPLLYLSVAVMSLVFAAGVRGQTTVSIEGQVIDAVDGHPIYQAAVRIRQSDYLSRTDGFGKFMFEHVPPGSYRLEATAEGYENYSDEIIVTDDITLQVDIVLKRRIYELPGRRVRGALPAPPITASTVVTREEIDKSHADDVGDILSEVPGVYVRESGPSGGKTLISIRGSETKHVLILLDGQRLTGAGNGDADVSTIPIEMVERMRWAGSSISLRSHPAGPIMPKRRRKMPGANGRQIRIGCPCATRFAWMASRAGSPTAFIAPTATTDTIMRSVRETAYTAGRA